WRAASVVAQSSHSEAHVRELLAKAGHACGLGLDGDPNEIARAINNGFGYGLVNPRVPTEKATKGRAGTGKKETPTIPLERVEDEDLVIQGSKVNPRV